MDLNLFDVNWNRNAVAATESALVEVENTLGLRLSDEYKELLRCFDGGEGFIGENYLILWSASELIQFNEEYEVQKYVPDVFLFGSSGGGEAFGFDLRDGARSILQLPFIGMNIKYARKVGNSFSEFLSLLSREVL